MNKPLHALILAFVFAFQWTGCRGQRREIPAGTVKRPVSVRAEFIARIPLEEIKERMAIFPGGSEGVGSGVRAYRLAYRMPLPEGDEGEVSGLLLVPEVRRDSLTLLSYQHGTLFSKQQAPSVYRPSGSEGYVLGTAVAALDKGYLVALPDYLGYGVSAASFHPYVHRKSLAAASMCMLEAARQFAADSGILVRRSVILAGYSEGGYATMALHRTIDEEAAGSITVRASYPGAGPYDILATARQVMQTDRATSPMFMISYAWVTVTYNREYGIGAPLSDYFTPGNLAAVTGLSNGDVAGASGIDPNPARLFTPAFRAGILDSTNRRMVATLQDNNLYDWKPSGEVVLYHSTDDRWVPVLNSEHAYAAMKARGARVHFVPLSGDHGGRAAGQYFYLLLGALRR